MSLEVLPEGDCAVNHCPMVVTSVIDHLMYGTYAAQAALDVTNY